MVNAALSTPRSRTESSILLVGLETVPAACQLLILTHGLDENSPHCSPTDVLLTVSLCILDTVTYTEALLAHCQ